MDFDYIKNHSRLIAVDLSRQKELDADPKAIQPIESAWQLKSTDGTNADDTQAMFILAIVEKIKETRIKLSQGNVTTLQKIANYEEAISKSPTSQLKKLKSADKIRLEQI